MMKALMLAATMAVAAVAAAPAGAQTVEVEKRITTDAPDRKVIIRDRTGSLDDEDCVKTKTSRTDVVTGDKEVRVRKDCD